MGPVLKAGVSLASGRDGDAGMKSKKCWNELKNVWTAQEEYSQTDDLGDLMREMAALLDVVHNVKKHPKCDGNERINARVRREYSDKIIINYINFTQ